MIEDNIIDEKWFENNFTKSEKQKKDFKGLYIYIHNDIPFYVGISKGVIGRTIQHLKGHNHHSASLAYNIAKLLYKLEVREEYTKTRKEFDFNYATRVKDLLLKQKIAFIPISNDEEMYLFEIYCAMKYKCELNKFETH
ncbi:hypothetical protein [Flavobacterium sp.]|uniref:hypothetical protein n=1 Tax=Flavobacterium sp. TaxID=239 RepID=UPI00374D14CC